MSRYDQSTYDLRFEWGLEGAKQLSSAAEVSIVVDVLSFSTCVDVATSNGAHVYPFLFKDSRAIEYAQAVGGVCADPKRSKSRPCLSPRTLLQLEPGAKVVLPSPNGSTIAFSIESPNVLCGCLRNATAVAKKAAELSSRILIIAAGERWPDGSLRPALEDIIGAGAILSCLPGTKSPESIWAIKTFEQAKDDLHQTFRDCLSGRELIACGFPEDVDDAAEYNVSTAAPILQEKFFHNEKN